MMTTLKENERSASSWHANEDYDHKRKLVTILAYLVVLSWYGTCYYLFNAKISNHHWHIHTLASSHRTQNSILGPGILSKSQYPKGKQWQITAMTYIDDEIVNIHIIWRVCVLCIIVWFYLARNSQSPFGHCLCVFCWTGIALTPSQITI